MPVRRHQDFVRLSLCQRKHRRGVSLVDLFGGVLLLLSIVALLLPGVTAIRESARRTSCAHSLGQVALAVRSYHSAFDQFPVQLSGTDGSLVVGADNDRQLSYLVGLLPFLDLQQLHERINAPGGGGAADELFDFDDYMEVDMDMEPFASDQSVGQRIKQDDSPAGGREPWSEKYYPWILSVQAFRCMSDPASGTDFAPANYAACFGDGVDGAATGPYRNFGGEFVHDAFLAERTAAAMRGVFVPRVVTRLSDIHDGQSQTILLAEICIDIYDEECVNTAAQATRRSVVLDHPNWARDAGLIDLERPGYWNANATLITTLNSKSGRRPGRGFFWADGMPLNTGFNTILPPNREISLIGPTAETTGILPPSSRHYGGVNVAFADGRVAFVTDSIDSGNTDQPTVYSGSPNLPGSKSPFGLWGALGTRDSAEISTISVSAALSVE